MRLLSLNVWGGTIYGPLMDFVREQLLVTDIFCFQEVFSSKPGAPEVSSGARMFLFEELSELLNNFDGFFCERSSGCDFERVINAPVSHGLAIFVKKSLKVKSGGCEFIAETQELADHFIKAQTLNLIVGNKSLSIINFHGVARPGEKLDTPERLDQSRKLADIWKSLGSAPKILCGDFNLMPNTESIQILQECGRNLIADFKIENTRNKISWDRFHNKQHFADYTFTSPEIQVTSFEVPYNEVSDHLPMILDFTVD